ncbi:MAG: hypothetical protein ACXV3S_04880, partial [Kineosporiaceae bacterium]
MPRGPIGATDAGDAAREEFHVLFGTRLKTTMVNRDEALPGRDHRPYPVPKLHAVLGTPLEGPWPDGTEVLYVA